MPLEQSRVGKRKLVYKMFIDKYLLELDIKSVLFKMKDEKPSSLSTQQLLDFHRKTHMLYEGAKKRKPQNKAFINSMVELHDRFVSEMLKRKMKHNTPLKKI